MQISQKSTKEFQGIYQKVFKEEIDYKKAEETATKFLNLLIVIYKPLKNEDHETKPKS